MITVPHSPLRAIELVFGSALGIDSHARAISSDEFPPESPREAFRAVIRDALQSGPCFVSFSGGRDSSAVMAVAVDVAREAALSLPVPVTKVLPHVPESEESEWQDLVLGHLGVKDRVVIECAPDADDIFGPDGIEALTRIGVSFPPNVRTLLKVMRHAAGGTLMTGTGGDELGNAATTRWAARALAEGRASSRVRATARLPRMASSARYVRTILQEPSEQLEVSPWLTRRASLALRREIARENASEPISWRDLLLGYFPRTRYRTLIDQSVDALAAPYQVRMLHPLWERRTLAALATARPLEGYLSRAAIFEDIAAGLLPEAVTRRTTKAYFTANPWGREAENLIARWDGSGVDTTLVDVGVLRDEWRLPLGERTGTSVPLLQSVWLHQQGIIS
ncbi:MAG: hypothetical protein INR66_02060 [Gordonia polyisoprenivorans]|nr:hypothetical protein [Gordonia polyisoprenivorans]